MSLKSIGRSPNGQMGHLAVISMVLLFSSTCRGDERSPSLFETRVVGGSPAPSERFRYMCSLRKDGGGGHGCGGVLINEKWVLTAAHCLDPDLSTGVGRRPRIFCDIYKIDDSDESKRFTASRCVLHHLWNGDAVVGKDIALCQLETSAKIKFPKLSGSGQKFTANSRFSVIGAGLEYMPRSTCNREGPWPGLIKHSVICAGFGYPSTCVGDSGGPLLIPHNPDSGPDKGDPERDLIAGITSFGLKDCEADAPSVYTRVSCYDPWITCITEATGQDCSVYEPCDEGPSLCTDRQESATFDENDALRRMLRAISSNDSESVKKILCEGLNPNRVFGENDNPLLHRAAASNSVGPAKVLIQGGAYLDSQTNYGQSAMQRAAGHGFLAVLRLLIDRGANIEVSSPGGWTPLMNAAGGDQLEALKILLDSGANIENTNNLGETALHFAARGGSPDTANELITRGAEVETKTKDESTPLHLAAAHGHPLVTRVLLGSKASKTVRNEDGETPFDVICAARDLGEPCTDKDIATLKELLEV